MQGEVLVAILALIGTIVGTLGGIVASARLTAYRISQLEDRVNKHNNFAARMPVVEEQIKVINHRLEDLETIEREK